MKTNKYTTFFKKLQVAKTGMRSIVFFNRTRQVLALAYIFLLSASFGCKKDNDGILGTWSADHKDGAMDLSFEADGTLSASGGGFFPKKLHGTWRYATNSSLDQVEKSVWQIANNDPDTIIVRLTARGNIAESTDIMPVVMKNGHFSIGSTIYHKK
jgi:hypothetical protein